MGAVQKSQSLKHIQVDSETLLQHRHNRPYLTQFHNNMKSAFSICVCFFVIEGKCLNSDFNAFGFTLSLSGVLSSHALSSLHDKPLHLKYALPS